MEERKGPSKAEILKMAIDGLTGKDKEEFQEIIRLEMVKANELPVKNKIKLQVG